MSGKIKQATDGTLFLDEFDKLHPDATGAYGELLRVLEAEEYFPIKGNDPQKVENVNWIMAGAFSSLRKVQDLPPDIWSRFTHEMRISDPIEKEGSPYIVSLFLYWAFAEALTAINGGPRHGAATGNIDRLIDKNSYKANCIRKLLFDDMKSIKEKGTEKSILSPGPGLLQVARAFARYAGTYYIYRSSDNTLPQRPLFVPCPQQEVEKFRKWAQADVALALRKTTLDPDPKKLVLTNDTDGIRAIRQGTRVLFERLVEASLEQGPSSFSFVAGDDFADTVKMALKQSFTTIDLARKGEKAEIIATDLQSVKIRTDSFCKLGFDLDPAAEVGTSPDSIRTSTSRITSWLSFRRRSS